MAKIAITNPQQFRSTRNKVADATAESLGELHSFVEDKVTQAFNGNVGPLSTMMRDALKDAKTSATATRRSVARVCANSIKGYAKFKSTGITWNDKDGQFKVTEGASITSATGKNWLKYGEPAKKSTEAPALKTVAMAYTRGQQVAKSLTESKPLYNAEGKKWIEGLRKTVDAYVSAHRVIKS